MAEATMAEATMAEATMAEATMAEATMAEAECNLDVLQLFPIPSFGPTAMCVHPCIDCRHHCLGRLTPQWCTLLS